MTVIVLCTMATDAIEAQQLLLDSATIAWASTRSKVMFVADTAPVDENTDMSVVSLSFESRN